MNATQPRPPESFERTGATPTIGAVNEPSMVASGITKRWTRRQEPILDNLDFEIPPGSIVGLRGANGAGKTTLLRILAGLFLPNSGTVTLKGLDPIRDRRAYQLHLGFLPAGQGGLYARLSVKNHLDYWARLALLPPVDRRQAVIIALARFDLVGIASKRVDRLSMGQRQRVRLAMAFLHEPDVVLLDEPRNSLDDAGVARLVWVLGEFKRAGKSVVWCAPSVDDVDLELDAVHELAGGRLMQL
jgi:ABC-type multidrug transport system ATPase subunit